jgi:hypothetical protein
MPGFARSHQNGVCTALTPQHRCHPRRGRIAGILGDLLARRAGSGLPRALLPVREVLSEASGGQARSSSALGAWL